MRNSDQWFGNFTFNEEMNLCPSHELVPRVNFKNFTSETKERIITKKQRVQEARSYQIMLVKRDDIWESKFWFRNRIIAMIKEANLITETNN